MTKEKWGRYELRRLDTQYLMKLGRMSKSEANKCNETLSRDNSVWRWYLKEPKDKSLWP